MQYDNNMRGGLWKNKKKEKPAQPDYTGHVEIEGKKWAMSGWMNVAQTTGEPYMSIKLSEFKPRDTAHAGHNAPAPSATNQSMDDAIPF